MSFDAKAWQARREADRLASGDPPEVARAAAAVEAEARGRIAAVAGAGAALRSVVVAVGDGRGALGVTVRLDTRTIAPGRLAAVRRVLPKAWRVQR